MPEKLEPLIPPDWFDTIVGWILTLFAFRRKMYYLCNSQAGLSTGKSRFFDVFKVFFRHFWPYRFLKLPVLEFKFQVFVLKFRYGLFQL